MDAKPGPSGLGKKKGDNSKKLTDEELLKCLDDRSGDEYLPDSEDENYSSESETESDSDAHDDEQSSGNRPASPANTGPAPTNTQVNFQWTKTGALKQFTFKKNQQLLVPVPGRGRPIDFFNLIIDDTFLSQIVEQTNDYAVQVFLSIETYSKSRITNWKHLTVPELKIFIGLLLHTGTIQLTRVNDYWKTDPLFNIPIFRKHMSRNRFLLILRYLHFTSANTRADDRLGKIRSVVDFFNTKMNSLYYPGKELSLDESMVLWRGRLLFKQYIQNKRHKYGIKLYMLTEPDGLVLKFRVYQGSSDEYSGTGHTTKVVMHLLEEKLGQGHAVYLDNFYNSVDLATRLLENDTYCTGTLRSDRKHNPQDVMKAKLKRGENESRFSNGIHIGKWKDKRDVNYISTEFGNETGIFKNKRGKETEKPKAILNYNNYMSGIDRQDQMLSYYPCNRKTIRWYKKLFIHVLQMSLTNAHYLHRKYSGGHRLRFYDFRLEVIGDLLGPSDDVLVHPPNQKKNPNARHCLSKIEKTMNELKKGRTESKRVSRKECRTCRKNKIRKQTTFECKECPGNPGFCVKCFEDFHKKM